jgi:hypothetical protein
MTPRSRASKVEDAGEGEAMEEKERLKTRRRRGKRADLKWR